MGVTCSRTGANQTERPPSILPPYSVEGPLATRRVRSNDVPVLSNRGKSVQTDLQALSLLA